MDGLLTAQYEFRSTLIRRIERDLLGPGTPDEKIKDAPITRYVTGILFPLSEDAVAPEQDLDLAEDYDETSRPEPTVAMANARYPSSMGLTFAVEEAADLVVEVQAARYLEQHDADHESDRGWSREPLDIQPVPIDATKDGVRREAIAEGLELFVRVRAADRDGRRSITVALANRLATKGLRDAFSFFQPEIAVTAADGRAVFVQRRAQATGVSDRDLRSYRLLYRNAANFAIGHGCAATWDAEGPRARSVRTTFVPRFAVNLAESNPAIELEVLGLRYLTDASRAQVVGGLLDLCRAYSEWIDARQADASVLEDDLAEIAGEHLDDCRVAAERMQAGVRLLADDGDDLAWTAFRFMNEAMLEQRSRTDWLASGKPPSGPERDGSHAWRAFQLAFILVCLPGLTRDDHEREIADLLWFPTGGGKTEAYLGLIAYTLFLRRLREASGGGGVAVIMRYTLRLLTIQQFERAALLICSCEAIRRREPVLGAREISIGLWVGQAGTPNSLGDARKALDRLRLGEELEEGNPMQLRRCPWCGTALASGNYFIGDRRPKLFISCRQDGCDFARGLPVLVIDEDIYRYRPSLVIATADKFALLPWNENVRHLFNRGSDDPPPELIIQDELHLISGPLGTLAGLYETAVEILCAEAGRQPKIVASTATIRRAHEQTRALFGRPMRQFPPAAVDQGDSWFAVDAPPERRGTRLYSGLMAPGTSQATLLVRTYAALLQAVHEIEAPAEVKDPYWTLIGYFNSLRVLAGARMQVQDDVRDRLDVLAEGVDPRVVERTIELTSREPSSRIPQHLADMDVSHPDPRALDVILATNMISVGVDINRLGLMVVMGQPQATAEYIQSTSRVGRQFPGLVLALFNSARSRDRSHYEAFETYHGALYRQVESTSVTPFSSRARERALHAILISLCRMLEPAFGPNDGAAAAASERATLTRVHNLILDRVKRVEPQELESTQDELDDIIELWIDRASERRDLQYANPYEPERALLIQATGEDSTFDELPTLNSLRDVDQESDIYLVR